MQVYMSGSTKVECGTKCNYRLVGDDKVHTVTFYGDDHGQQAQDFARIRGLLSIDQTDKSVIRGLADYCEFTPCERGIK